LQVDDDGFGGPRGTFPLYLAVSLGGALAATLAAIGFVTFQHVESSAADAVAVHAGNRIALRGESGVAPSPSAPARVAAPVMVVRHRPHLVRSPNEASEVKASALPSATRATAAAALVADPVSESRASTTGVSRHRATGARHVTSVVAAGPGGAAPSGAEPGRGSAAPVILTATSVATPEPMLPGTAAPGQAASPPPAEAAAPEATPAVVAAAPAAVRSPAQVVEAHVKLAAQPDFPSDPSVAGLHGTSAVLVTIGPRGGLVNVALEHSSGHASFDQAALNAARRTLYAAALIDGKPATASYRMVYEFGQ
jgi:TonB family protein